MEKFLYIPVEGPMEIHEIPIDEVPQVFFDRVRELVGCKWLEFVHCGEYILLVDELGKIIDPPKPVNPRASLLYPGTDFGDPIVGNCLIGAHGFRDGESDIVGLSPAQIQILRGFFLAVGEAH